MFEKYDEYVPEELVRKGFALGVLDIEGMRRRVLGWPKTMEEKDNEIEEYSDCGKRY